MHKLCPPADREAPALTAVMSQVRAALHESRSFSTMNHSVMGLSGRVDSHAKRGKKLDGGCLEAKVWW